MMLVTIWGLAGYSRGAEETCLWIHGRRQECLGDALKHLLPYLAQPLGAKEVRKQETTIWAGLHREDVQAQCTKLPVVQHFNTRFGKVTRKLNVSKVQAKRKENRNTTSRCQQSFHYPGGCGGSVLRLTFLSTSTCANGDFEIQTVNSE